MDFSFSLSGFPNLRFKTWIKRKSLVPMGEYPRYLPTYTTYIYGLYNGFMGQYGLIFGEQLLGYLPKGTPNFPVNIYIYIYLNLSFVASCPFPTKTNVFSFFPIFAPEISAPYLHRAPLGGLREPGLERLSLVLGWCF